MHYSLSGSMNGKATVLQMALVHHLLIPYVDITLVMHLINMYIIYTYFSLIVNEMVSSAIGIGDLLYCYKACYKCY